MHTAYPRVDYPYVSSLLDYPIATHPNPMLNRKSAYVYNKHTANFSTRNCKVALFTVRPLNENSYEQKEDS